VVASTEANFLGAFQFTAPGPGVYSIQVQGMGYLPTSSRSLRVRAGDTVTVELAVAPDPVALDTLVVMSRRQRISAALQTQGFYDRQQQGVGSFLTEQQIRRWATVNVGDVLRHAPFVTSEWSLGGGSTIYVHKYGRCQPTIYVDANRINSSPDDWVNPEDIVAVEVYRGQAEIPLEWGGTGESCGVILIWTKQIRRGGGDGPLRSPY
jgi:hypothetical protein